MRVSLSIISAALAATSAYASEFKVTVYEGPTECEDSDKIASGNYLTMHYTGTIDESSEAGEKGKQFDSSRDRDDPFQFQIGGGQVIKGWDQGLVGLCKGAKATLILPPDYGYGDQGAGGEIPGGATLNFDVEVIEIGDASEAPPEPNYFLQLDTNSDGKIDRDEVKAYLVENGQDESGVDHIFSNEDTDGDGFISWDEFSGPKGDAPEEDASTEDVTTEDAPTEDAPTGDEL